MSDSLSVAVVGGAGFIGSRLTEVLDRSNIHYTIYDLSSKQAGFKFYDVSSSEKTSIFRGADWIVNLAAEHRDDVRPLTLYERVNVDGAKNVCQAARDSGVQKILFTSSVAIYGFAPPNTGENGEPNYFNEYGRTKYLAEQIYRDWQREDPLTRTLVIVRPTVVFGPGNRGNVYNLLRQIASKRFVMIGAGNNIKSMAYVENVAEFLRHALSFTSGVHVYNYVDKPDLSINQLVVKTRTQLFGKNDVGLRIPGIIGGMLGWACDIIARVTQIRLPLSSIRVKKFMMTTQFDTRVGQSGFIPTHSLDSGLAKTLRYEFQEHRSSASGSNPS